MSGGEIVVGVLLAGAAAVFLALAMSVQRYALVTKPPVPMLMMQLPQSVAWFIGLVIYWVANGLFAMSLIFAPLALLGAIFTTLLVWNLFFGWYLLNEKITPIKAVGAVIIMVGVSLIGVGTPGGIPVEYSQATAEAFLNSTSGSAFLAILITIVVVCVVIIAIFEKNYPLPEDEETASTGDTTWLDKILKMNGLAVYQGDEVVSLAAFSGGIETGGLADISKKVESTGLAEISKQIVVKQKLLANDNTPAWMNNVMGWIYPGSLGLDEGIGHLAMKSFMALLATCGDNGECGSGILWGMIMLWLVSSLATLWWLRTVFRRYDVTQALPIEYGGVMACDALSAIIYYGEDNYMEKWQLTMTLIGVSIIIVGIIVGRMQPGSQLQERQEYQRFMLPDCFKKQDRSEDEVPMQAEPTVSKASLASNEDSENPAKRSTVDIERSGRSRSSL